MSDIDFGDRVHLSHVLRPVYVKWQTTKQVPDPGKPWFPYKEIDVEGHLSVAGPYDDPDLGLPLPDPSPDPSRKNQVARRLRRFPSEAVGIVVGRTYRAEGDYHAGGGGVDYFGEADYEPSYLSESRRIQVYQVAIGESWPDRTAWPAAIVLAIPEDMQVQP